MTKGMVDLALSQVAVQVACVRVEIALDTLKQSIERSGSGGPRRMDMAELRRMSLHVKNRLERARAEKSLPGGRGIQRGMFVTR